MFNFADNYDMSKGLNPYLSQVAMLPSKMNKDSTYELMRIGEQTIDPAVAQAQSKQVKEEVQEAKREHIQVKKILGQMESMEPEDENWEMKLKELEQDVEHHVREEEEEIFPEARKVLSADELAQLGERMTARKQELEKSMRVGAENAA